MDYFKSFYSESTRTTYSLDMVRLNIDFGKHLDSFVKGFIQPINDTDLRYDVTYMPNFKRFAYRHLWTFKDTLTQCSWTLGLDLGRDTDDKSKGFIEFNPNKCELSTLFHEFWRVFEIHTISRELVRFDVAIDMPLMRHQCSMLTKHHKLYQLVRGDDGITEYLGRRSSNGFIKLYDKTAESHLDETITRLEITCDKNCDIEKIFPTVLIYDNQLNLDLELSDLSDTFKVLVTLLRNSDMKSVLYPQLAYRIRKKIEPYIADKVLSLDKNCYFSVRDVALSYTL